MAITQQPVAQRVIYPETDGKPMAETDVHRHELMATIETLETFFANTPNVYVAGNMMLYYEEGNNGASVAPDVFVVRGVPKRQRRAYKLWEETQASQIVIELTSRSTCIEDQGVKRVHYTSSGVQEYVLFDPIGECLRPPLKAYRLRDDDMARVELDADGSFLSQVLGLRLRVEENELRIYNEATGERLLRSAEARARGALAEEQARLAEERAQAAEAEVERLRAELARLRSENA